jgi:tetratricopeptide (TPR) repeat protein
VHDLLDGTPFGDPDTLDLDQYARDTAHIALSLGERYRQLAIHLECTLDVGRWPPLKRAYDAAVAADPTDPHVWTSRAIARSNTTFLDAEGTREVVGWGRRAVAFAPDDGYLNSVLGQFLYHAGLLDEAEPVLRHALALGRKGWTHLWLAHTLHDLKRWAEAAAAYQALPAAAMPAAWRVQLARQQRAQCLQRAGRREDALVLYTEVLERYERALDAGLDAISSPVLDCGYPSYLLDDLGFFPELVERTTQLCIRLNAHSDEDLHCSPGSVGSV